MALLQVNAVRNLAEMPSPEQVQEINAGLDEITAYIEASRAPAAGSFNLFFSTLPLLILILSNAIIIFMIYRRFLKPFQNLEIFAENIARGNWEIPLEYQRVDYFGKFTWAFDNMRNELKQSKERERAAIEANKLVISTLSHDIKTPVSTIRAYAEALDSGIIKTAEQSKKYTTTIMRKADEIAQRSNDLLLHAVSELDKLEVNLSDIRLDIELRKALSIYEFSKLDVQIQDEPWPTVSVRADAFRLEQIIENIMRNAEKYAPGRMDISLHQEADYACISFRDYGAGIPDQDLPFVRHKFYRGSNSKAKEGAGLGLFIVSELMQKMNGKVELQNHTSGLTVQLFFALDS